MPAQTLRRSGSMVAYYTADYQTRSYPGQRAKVWARRPVAGRSLDRYFMSSQFIVKVWLFLLPQLAGTWHGSLRRGGKRSVRLDGAGSSRLAGIAQAREAKLRVAWITPGPVEKNEDGAAIEGYNRTGEVGSAGGGRPGRTRSRRRFAGNSEQGSRHALTSSAGLLFHLGARSPRRCRY